MQKSSSKKFSGLFAVVLSLAVSAGAVKAQDLKVEDIVSKHLDSIGTKEKREQIKNQMAIGTSEFESKLPTRKTTGKAAIVSEAGNLLFIASLASKEYPFEKIGFFTDKISLPFVTAGTRSPLGAYINDHSRILSEGLFTGGISSKWSLLNPPLKKGKLNSAGMKKVDGRKTYVLNYYLNGSSNEFTINLFFDAQTFQHVRTEYRHVISPREIIFGSSNAHRSGVEIAMTEEFGDFKDENGLTLPRSYKIKYLTASDKGTYEYKWGVTISQYLFNQKLAPNFFSFDEK
ncbi:MAG TPA: hypothetical protein VNI60_07140 [Pyrinomonadaceae bacterium]|nr:hypothetical protein [Pyrinomonadaceae bacterium]